MSTAETIVSTLKAKLILDASGFTKTAESVSKELGIDWGGLAQDMKKVGTVASATAKDAAKAAMNYETAFTAVKKTVDTPPGTDAEKFFKDLSKTIIETTKVMPVSATELANVYAIAGQLGIGTEYLTDFSNSMVKLASATNLTSEEAAIAFARFANITHMDQGDFPKLGSTVVALGNNMAVSEKEIAEYTQRLALMGHMTGMAESDIAAFGATFASLGLESASSATAMIRFTNQITGAVSSFTGTSSDDLEMFANITNMTKEQLETLSESTGLSVDELKSLGDNYTEAAQHLEYFAQAAEMTEGQFADLWQKDAASALEAFFQGFNTMTNDEQIKYLQDIGVEQINEQTLLRSLASGSDTLSASLDMASGAWEENTAMNAEAAAAFETTESQLTMLQNTMDALAITAGDTLLPAIKDIAEELSPILENITKFVSENPELTKDLLIAGISLGLIGNAITIMSPIVKAFGKEGEIRMIGEAMKNAIPHIKDFGSNLISKACPALVMFGQNVAAFVVANPWLGIAAAIVGVIALLALLISQTDDLTTHATASAEAIESMSTNTQQLVQNGYGELEIWDKNYIQAEISGIDMFGNYYEEGDLIRFSELTGEVVSQQYDLAAANQQVAATATEAANAISEQQAVMNSITENSAGEQMTESVEGTKSALEQAQEILDQLTQSSTAMGDSVTQSSDTMTQSLEDSMNQLQALYESDAYQMVMTEPVDSAVAESWTSVSEAVGTVTTGLETIEGLTEFTKFPTPPQDARESWENFAADVKSISDAFTAIRENAGFSTIPAIPEATVTSYATFADAVWKTNTALTGQTVDETGAIVPVEVGEGEGPVGLVSVLSKIPELLGNILTKAQEVAAYLTGGFPEAINTLLKVLVQVETNEKGETSANGGNTLYTALGSIFGLLEDILGTSRAIAQHWKGEFVEAIKELKKQCGIGVDALSNLSNAAVTAQGAFEGWASAIQMVIDLINELSGMDIPDISGFTGGGTGTPPGRAKGGPVSGRTTYLVGEKGPELFTPSRNGFIIPNNTLMELINNFGGMRADGGKVKKGQVYLVGEKGKEAFLPSAAIKAALQAGIQNLINPQPTAGGSARTPANLIADDAEEFTDNMGVGGGGGGSASAGAGKSSGKKSMNTSRGTVFNNALIEMFSNTGANVFNNPMVSSSNAFTPSQNGYLVSSDDLNPSGRTRNTNVSVNFNGDVIGDEASISEYVTRATRSAIREEVYAAV